MALDMADILPAVWREMIEYFGVKSLLDVGCGRGTSTLWFYLQGIDTHCVEGSHDAITQNLVVQVLKQEKEKKMIKKEEEEENESSSSSLKEEEENENEEFLPMITSPQRIVEHDFSRGPWWPEKTVDAVWCVELLEHIGRNFMPNYIPSFQKAALIFASHSRWGGWHHTEVHKDEWWIAKFQSFGFVYSESMTKRVRDIAREESGGPSPIVDTKKQNSNNTEPQQYENYLASHVYGTMMVFINPKVASLPQHSHIFAEPGCFTDYGKPNVHCGDQVNKENSPIPEEFKFIPFNSKREKEWASLVNSNLLKNQ